jgi:peptide/nickel transport system permease protein
MIRFVAKRLGGLLLTLFVASFAVYGAIYLSPGSPEAVLFGNHPPSPEVRAAVRHFLGLDRPFLVRYAVWLDHVAHGDLGRSVISQQAVTDRIAAPLDVTLALVAYAAVLIVVFGVGLGLLSALKPGPVDATVTGVVSLATAMPAFVTAALLTSFFAVRLGWFPSFGLEPGFGGWLRSLTLPAVSLAVIASGLVARVTRTATRQVLASDHVITAGARGLSWRRTIRSHVLRNSAGPVLSVTGLQVASLFAGAVVVEQAFGLNGLGGLLISSIEQKDFPVVQAIALLLVTAFVVLNAVADVLVAALDPGARRAVAR